jgi:hypothetical protein
MSQLIENHAIVGQSHFLELFQVRLVQIWGATNSVMQIKPVKRKRDKRISGLGIQKAEITGRETEFHPIEGG